MIVGKFGVQYERRYNLLRGRHFELCLAVDDPDGQLNYAAIHYKRATGEWFNTVGWKPSITHHTRLRGTFATYEEAMHALLCELRMRSYKKGTREYAEAYRDRWLPGTELVDELPDGWHVNEKTLTEPSGTRWISNGESLFGGAYEHKLLLV